MDSSVSLKDQIWFLRMCHHVPNVLYCIRCTALLLVDVVGSGCGALRCRNASTARIPTAQRPTTATNHIQQKQSSTPHAVTHGICPPEDGHNDARNMLRQMLIINIWLLHLVGFFRPSSQFFTHFWRQKNRQHSLQANTRSVVDET